MKDIVIGGLLIVVCPILLAISLAFENALHVCLGVFIEGYVVYDIVKDYDPNQKRRR